MAYKTRAGGCVAPPIKGTSGPPSDGNRVTTGEMPRAGKPTAMHIDSQTEYGLHERDDALPPDAVKQGWKK